eukprot:scaffold8_cov249-Pinguiococcus_pyrenoidosus.AAC.26
MSPLRAEDAVALVGNVVLGGVVADVLVCVERVEPILDDMGLQAPAIAIWDARIFQHLQVPGAHIADSNATKLAPRKHVGYGSEALNEVLVGGSRLSADVRHAAREVEEHQVQGVYLKISQTPFNGLDDLVVPKVSRVDLARQEDVLLLVHNAPLHRPRQRNADARLVVPLSRLRAVQQAEAGIQSRLHRLDGGSAHRRRPKTHARNRESVRERPPGLCIHAHGMLRQIPVLRHQAVLLLPDIHLHRVRQQRHKARSVRSKRQSVPRILTEAHKKHMAHEAPDGGLCLWWDRRSRADLVGQRRRQPEEVQRLRSEVLHLHAGGLVRL